MTDRPTPQGVMDVYLRHADKLDREPAIKATVADTGWSHREVRQVLKAWRASQGADLKRKPRKRKPRKRKLVTAYTPDNWRTQWNKGPTPQAGIVGLIG